MNKVLTARDGVDGWARAGLFVLLPGAAVAGGLALAVLVAAAGAVSMRLSLLRQVLEKRTLAVLALLAFTAWAVLSSAWSPYPDHIQAPKLALMIWFGLLFAAAAITPAARRGTRAAGLAAFLVLALLLAIEAFWGLPLNRASQPPGRPDWIVEANPGRGVTVLVAMIWAIAGGLLVWGGRMRAPLAAAALMVGAVLAAQFHHFANTIGYGLGLAAFGLGLAAPRWAPALIAAMVALWLLAAPFVTPLLFTDPRLIEALPYSWAARIGIWDYVCARIGEQPWIGHGLDASRAVADMIDVQGAPTIAVPLHPHSASLQIWFETGLVGAGLGAAGLVAGGLSLSRAFANNRPAAAAACATIAALSFIANASYGIWQEWWIATMFVAAALVGAIPAGVKPRG